MTLLFADKLQVTLCQMMAVRFNCSGTDLTYPNWCLVRPGWIKLRHPLSLQLYNLMLTVPRHTITILQRNKREISATIISSCHLQHLMKELMEPYSTIIFRQPCIIEIFTKKHLKLVNKSTLNTVLCHVNKINVKLLIKTAKINIRYLYYLQNMVARHESYCLQHPILISW